MKQFLIIIGFLAGLAAEPVSGNDSSNYDKKLKVVNEFVNFANHYDVDGIESLFDKKAFGKIVAKKANLHGQMAKSFAAGVESGLNRILVLLIRNAENTEGHYKYVGDSASELVKGPMIRADYGDHGMDYIIPSYVIHGDKAYINDFFIATSGKFMSDQIASAANLMIKPSKSFTGMILGKKQLDKSVIEAFKEISRLRFAGDYQGAYKKLSELPEQVKNSRIAIDMALEYAGNMDDETYHYELSRLAHHFGDDPTLSFTLIDFYYLNKDYTKALNAVVTFEGYFGEDGQTNILKANLNLEKGLPEVAEKHAKMCALVEPDLEDCYWTVVAILNGQEKYSDLVQELDLLSSTYGYEFTKAIFREDQSYRGFVNSRAFKEWTIPNE